MENSKSFRRKKDTDSPWMPFCSANSSEFERMKESSIWERAAEFCRCYCHTPQKPISFVGVEIQKGLAECAQKNVFLNRLEDRISILSQDFRELKRTFPPGSFDVVLSNPPYRKHQSGRINPSMEKAVARHEIKGTLEDLISTASYLLSPQGEMLLDLSRR